MPLPTTDARFEGLQTSLGNTRAFEIPVKRVDIGHLEFDGKEWIIGKMYAQTGTFADPTVQRFELFFPFECGVSFFLYFKKHFLLVVQANQVHQAEKHSKG